MDNKHSMVTRLKSKNRNSKNNVNTHNKNGNGDNNDDNEDYEHENNGEFNVDKVLLDKEINKIKKKKKEKKTINNSFLVNEILSTLLLPTVKKQNIKLSIDPNNDILSNDNNSEYSSGYDSDISLCSIDDECYSSMDEYDDEYDELLCQGYINNEEDTFEYFHKLSKGDKENCLKELKEINKLNESNIPLKFKILNSKMDIKTKSMAVNNIDKYLNTEISNGEFIKMEQWIDGLIKIPFGIYKELSINNNDSNKIKQEYFKTVKNTLDNSLYGHSEAKTQILQIIGKWIKEPLSNGNILALQGPMGNGKTTLVKEGIAKALDRPFVFIA